MALKIRNGQINAYKNEFTTKVLGMPQIRVSQLLGIREVLRQLKSHLPREEYRQMEGVLQPHFAKLVQNNCDVIY